jgi:hypothetical protein
MGFSFSQVLIGLRIARKGKKFWQSTIVVDGFILEKPTSVFGLIYPRGYNPQEDMLHINDLHDCALRGRKGAKEDFEILF